VSPPQSRQQPPSPNNIPHPSPAWSPSPHPLSHCLSSSQVLAPQARALKMPLHETQGPQKIGADGTVQPRHSILYYQPFNTTDLLNWRNHTPLYSDKPQAMFDFQKSIFQTHQHTWDDC
jgi:hypothetical protein